MGSLLWYPERHHCHHRHAITLGLDAAICSGRFYTSTVTGAVSFPMLLSAGFALPTWLFPLAGAQALWEQGTPRTYLAASSSLHAALGRKSLSFPLLNVLLLLL